MHLPKILAASLLMAVVGFCLHCCGRPALAFEGTEPVAVTNGDVSLSCPAGTGINSSGSHLLAGTGGDIDCTNTIPSLAAWPAANRIVYSGSAIDQYAVVESASWFFVELVQEAGAGDDRKAVGCAQTDTDGSATQALHLSYAGYIKCLKATGTAWSAGDRLKVTAGGVLDVAADTEWAVATAIYGTSAATSGFVVWGIQAPVTVTASVNLVAFASPMENLPSGSTTAYTAVANQGAMETSYTANSTSTNWMAGNIEAGLTCECNEAIGSGKSMDIKLCRNSSSCTGSDLLSTCSLAASATSCTDGSFSSSATSDGDDLFLKYERSGGTGVKCQRPSCRFAYSQTEY